jgi:hypothetical protein
VKIAPSILAADFANLAADVARVANDVDLLHVDCMDGHYVPNLTIGPPVVAALRPHTDLFLDCHLMVDNPGRLLPFGGGGRRCPVPSSWAIRLLIGEITSPDCAAARVEPETLARWSRTSTIPTCCWS